MGEAFAKKKIKKKKVLKQRDLTQNTSKHKIDKKEKTSKSSAHKKDSGSSKKSVSAGPESADVPKKPKRLDSLTARKQRNPKAFAINAPTATDKRARRKQDLEEKRYHIPLVDRTPLEPPPVIVAVVGPPQVGKTTLIKSLVKYYTKHGLSTANGPITVVSGKKRRISLIECNNDIHSMIDVAKIADLVLLMVDASFGFEMELFEFLNICQSHGFPKIMAILTHLDQIKTEAEKKKVKKTMKKRFWTEIYKGAKLFFVSGVMHGLYGKRDTQNIARYVSVMKFRPLTWQTAHPYVLVDRVEDLTDPELLRRNRELDRRISLYGFVRGTPLMSNSDIHIPGCGDFRIKSLSSMPDPCPLPKKKSDKQRRTLSEKERTIYAPFCGVGGVLCDRDAVYIDIAGAHSFSDRIATHDSDRIVNQMLESSHTIDDRMKQSEVKFFTDKVEQKLRMLSESSGAAAAAAADDDDDEKDQLSSVDTSMDEESSEDEFDPEDLDDDNPLARRMRQARKLGKNGGSSQARSMFDDPANDPSVRDVHNEKFVFDDDDDDADNDEDYYVHQGEPRKNLHRNPKQSFVMELPGMLDGFEDDEDDGLDELNDDELAELASIEGENKPKDLDEDDDENDDDDDDDARPMLNRGEFNWKDKIDEKAELSYYKRQNSTRDVQRLVYGGHSGYTSIHSGLAFNFDQQPDDRTMMPTENSVECTIDRANISKLNEYSYEQLLQSIKNKFVTGKWDKDKDAFRMMHSSDEEYGSDNDPAGDDDLDDEEFDDFEDLEEGKKFAFAHKKQDGSNGTKKEVNFDPTNEVPVDLDNDDAAEAKMRMLKKMQKKSQFDEQYDTGDFDTVEAQEKTFYETQKEKFQQQSTTNRSAFDSLDEETRLQVEGFRSGLYVRMELDRVPPALVDTFDPSCPLIVGGLNAGEVGEGYVRVRLKKHRWFKKILKNRDPMIVSMGWRRFQTVPVYHVMDDNMRNRSLKYTPWHLHCLATFWAPLAPQGTGMVAFQETDGFTKDFRISATGVVLELDKSADIVKKLKLVGSPMEIFNKTAFIKGMFNSSLEVSKFEGAPIRTVSGIRGLIKKAARTPEGAYRATFEDKILMSDLVFLRTWYHVEVPKFCITIKTLLMPKEERPSWLGARTVGRLRFEQGIKSTTSNNPDSIYKPMQRKQFNFRPFTIPKALQKELPYRDKPKFTPKQPDPIQRVTAIKTDEERQRLEALVMMGQLQKERMLKLKERKLIDKEKRETSGNKNKTSKVRNSGRR